MARHDAHAPSGPETFNQLKALLGRHPTVDELSREFDPAPAPRRYGLLFAVIGVIGLLWFATGFVLQRQPVPDLPTAPAIETAVALPALPAIVPPPLPEIEQAPIRRTVPAREQARSTTRRRTTAAPPILAARPPAPLPVEDAAIQQRVLPNVPASARRTITGRIRIHVRVSVDPAGNVTSASSDSPGPSKYFNGLAVKAAREWKFAPAAPDQADAARERVLRFEFARQDTSAAALPAVP